MMLGLGDALVSGSVGTRVIQPFGPVVPLDYVAQPFNCPAGSDFAASQRVGMCVAADFSPIYSQAAEGGAKTYYNLDGSVGGTEPGAAAQWLPGVPNALVLGALGLLLVMKMAR